MPYKVSTARFDTRRRSWTFDFLHHQKYVPLVIGAAISLATRRKAP
jgi:hypothetical protein